MRIGVIVDNELNNDIRVLREIRILRDHGHEITVLCFAFNNKSYSQEEGIKTERIRIKRRRKNTLFFFANLLPFYEKLWSVKIAKFIITNNIESLYVHDLYMSKAGHNGIKRSGKNIPLVLDLHENYPYTVTTYNWTKGFIRQTIAQPAKWLKKEEEYMKYAGKIVVLSDHFRDQLLKKYPGLAGKEFAVMPNVPDLSRLDLSIKSPVKKPFSNDYPVLFYYGVIAERRGIFDALEVFTELKNESLDLNFLLIGPVDKKDMTRFHAMISVPAVADRIHFIPWIDFSDFWSWLAICDFCIAPFHKNPQHESGIANKVFDYLLGKKPVAVSDCAPQKKLVEDFECGLVFSDREEMKDAIIKLCRVPELRKKMGDNGYNAIINFYNTEHYKGNLLKLFSSP